MNKLLEHVLRHNTWATATLLEFCGTLEPATLDGTASGTYGTLYGTLQHLVGAEQWYLKLLTGEVVGQPIRRTDVPRPLEDLAAVSRGTGGRILKVAASDDPDRPIAMNDGRDSTVGVVLAQLVHHGNEHRTQVTTILGANGIVPPPISAWGYGRAVGISKAEE